MNLWARGIVPVEGHVRRTLVIPLLYRQLGVYSILGAVPSGELELMEAVLGGGNLPCRAQLFLDIN